MEVTGPGVEPTGVVAGAPTQFKVNAERAGSAPLQATVLDASYNPVPVAVTDNKNGTYTCTYNPTLTGRHVVQVQKKIEMQGNLEKNQ